MFFLIAVHPSAMAVALQHQLTAAGLVTAGGLLKQTGGGVAAVTGTLTPTQPPTANTLAMKTEAETNAAAAASTLALLEPTTGALLHPALRNVKAINIGKYFKPFCFFL